MNARIYNAKTEDEIFMLALATLKNDHVKNEKIRLSERV